MTGALMTSQGWKSKSELLLGLAGTRCGVVQFYAVSAGITKFLPKS